MHKINQFDNNFNIIGGQIKKLRKNQNISQEYLCARMQTLGYKISRSDISKIENNKKFISDFEVLGFSKSLKTSVSKLYEGLE
jgi:transcriptional regulator with XRE-family HTH domain